MDKIPEEQKILREEMKKYKENPAKLLELQKKQLSFEENRTQLEQRISVVEQGLSRCGIRVIRLGTEEVIELFYKTFNPGDTEKPINSN